MERAQDREDCFAEEAGFQNERMGRAFDAVLSAARGQGSDPGVSADVEATQAAWAAFQAKQCEAQTRTAGSSVGPVAQYECEMRGAALRAVQLEAWRAMFPD